VSDDFFSAVQSGFQEADNEKESTANLQRKAELAKQAENARVAPALESHRTVAKDLLDAAGKAFRQAEYSLTFDLDELRRGDRYRGWKLHVRKPPGGITISAAIDPLGNDLVRMSVEGDAPTDLGTIEALKSGSQRDWWLDDISAGATPEWTIWLKKNIGELVKEGAKKLRG
jgi:hypothetical protein